jgi:hypothetical protein
MLYSLEQVEKIPLDEWYKFTVLAGKAVGFVVQEATTVGVWAHRKDSEKNSDGEYPIFHWTPATEDGDSTRLANALGIARGCGEQMFPLDPDTLIAWALLEGPSGKEHYHAITYSKSKDDADRAVRLAIHLVAAIVGRKMP